MDQSLTDRPPLIDDAQTQVLATVVVASSYAIVLAVASAASGAASVSEVAAAITPQTGLLALVGLMFGLVLVYLTVLDRLVSPPVVLVGVVMALWVLPTAMDTGDVVKLFMGIGEALVVLAMVECTLHRAIRRLR